MKPLRLFTGIFLILLATAVCLHVQSSRKPSTDITADQTLMRQVVPGSRTFRRAKTEAPVYEALGPHQELVGFAFYTRDFVKDIHGYGGPIEMIVGMDRSGTVTGITVTRQQETPAFTPEMSAFLNRITGKNIRTPLILDKNIDGITGATVTSSAIIATINAAAQKIFSHALMSETDHPAKTPLSTRTVTRLCLILLFLPAIWACTARRTIIRWSALLAGFLFLGIFSKEMLSTAHVAEILLLDTAGSILNLRLLLLLTAVITCLIVGRAYCVGVCPFGFVEEALFALNRKIFHRDMRPDKKTDHRCRWIKYVLFLLVLAVCIVYRRPGLGSIEPYITLFTGKGHALARALLGCILLGSFFFLRFWCRYLCPFGAFLGLIAQFRIRKRKRQKHSALNAITPVSPCAMPEECFYCDRCSQNEFNADSPKHNTFFLILIILSCLLFAAAFGRTVYDQHAALRPVKETTEPRQDEKTLAAPRIETYSKDSATAKEKLREAGITPRPAKYWKSLGDE